jgi:protein-disulfide isomerase/uncharacterized membrane protein
MAPVLLIIALIAAVAGFTFAATSTYDFVAHLDRQVHGLHCSFLPGVGTPDATGTSGCHVTLMSPYSSVMRDSIWGGIPISLPAMAVFAFLFLWGATLWLSDRKHDPRATGFFALATGVPALTSIVMGTIAIRELDAVCKVCVGIYIASTVMAVCALLLWLEARKTPALVEGAKPHMSMGSLVVAFVVGCVFVGVSVVAYAASTPDFDKYVGACGDLPGKDPQNVLIPLGKQGGSVQIIEIVDPLCPACRAFERRFAALDVYETASRRGLLFPLDNSCNWMVDSAVHPGACAISEAMLCAGDQADDVLDWAFEEQEQIVAAEREKAGSAAKLAVERFPSLAGCVGSSKAKARLNRALRWAVDNQLPVLTPQLYVNGKRLCDADTDLGLDFMLTRLVERTSAGSKR